MDMEYYQTLRLLTGAVESVQPILIWMIICSTVRYVAKEIVKRYS